MANAVIIDKVSCVLQVQPPSTFFDCETIPQLASKILQCLYETKQVVYKDAIIALEEIISSSKRSSNDIDQIDVKLRMDRFLENMLKEVKELKRQGITFVDEDVCPSYEDSLVLSIPSPNSVQTGEQRDIPRGNSMDITTSRFEFSTTGGSDQTENSTTAGRSASDNVIISADESSTTGRSCQPGTTGNQLPSYDEIMKSNKFKIISFF